MVREADQPFSDAPQPYHRAIVGTKATAAFAVVRMRTSLLRLGGPLLTGDLHARAKEGEVLEAGSGHTLAEGPERTLQRLARRSANADFLLAVDLGRRHPALTRRPDPDLNAEAQGRRV
jgi:hypothetical protein